jgi:uncharacterized protein YyaL (SSP411 family)
VKNSDNIPNKLIESKSPYLLQHAYNPVEWQPWSDNAWQEAREKQKLVLVSIGYSACHWCHVMEHESFEDHQTAEIMNISMVNIKVDREERPDVDMVYMDACQLMTGKGGWPLNVICLPDGRPVYAGTYFPMPQWQQLIIQLTTHFKQEPEKFEEYANKLYADLKNMNGQLETDKDLQFSRKNIFELFEVFAKDIDWDHGGQNRAPKFMLPGQFEFSLDYLLISGDERAKEFMHLSLLKMFNGGIYDTLRGGFYRYSTDKFWFAPHFEKMLYDNAQLISLYARAFAWSNASVYKDVVEQTIGFCERELKASNGGYFSALDADSEGIEGRFYVFTESECKSLLNDQEFEFAKHLYNISPDGNWEHQFNILHTQMAPLQIIEKMNLSNETYQQLLSSVKSKLFQLQESRVRPGLDFKIILSWNGLMLKGLSDAAFYLQNDHFKTLAIELEAFIWKHFYNPKNNELYRISSKDSIYGTGFLEDYACLIEGQLHLFQCTNNEIYIERAEILTNKAMELFYDTQNSQLYFAPNNGEQLILRKSDSMDDVIPSANSIFANCLNDLSIHTGNLKFKEISMNLLNQMVPQLTKFPGWYNNWTRLYMQATCGQSTVALSNHHHLADVLKIKSNLPSWIHVNSINENSVVQWLSHKVESQPQIFVCTGNQCFEPVDSVDQAIEILDDIFQSE